MMDSLLLYKILQNRTGAEISASGNPAIMSDTLKNNPMNEMKVFGWSKQESTTGANLIDVNSMLNDCLIKNEDETYSIKKIKGGRFSKAFPVNLKAGTAVRFNADIVEYNGEYDKSLQISFFNNQTLVAGQVIVLESDVTKAAIYQDSANNLGTYTKFKNAILSIGDIKIPYEPYTGGKPSPNPEYPQEIISAGSDGKIGIEVRGKNLLKIRDMVQTTRGVTVTAKDGVVALKGTATATGWVILDTNSFVLDGTYILSSNITAIQVRVANKSHKEVLKQNKSKTLENEEVSGVVFPVTSGKTYDVSNILVQIEKGSESTSYEPYHEPQSLSISTPTGLPAIPVDTGGNYTDADGQQWIADYIDLKRGKYVQNICDLPLKDISLEWYTWGVNANVSNGTGFFAYVTKYARVGNTKALATICRHHIDAWGGRRVGCNANINNSYITISLHTSDLEDASDNTKAIASFKKIVEQTDAHVLYVRAEPIETDLTTEEIQAYKNLVTYAGTTIVKNDAGCYMEVSAGGGDNLRAKKLALILGE